MSTTDHVRRSRPRGRRPSKKKSSQDQRQTRYMDDGRRRIERMEDDRSVLETETDISHYAHLHSRDGYGEPGVGWRVEEQNQLSGLGSSDRDSYEERAFPSRLREDLEREQLQQHWDELDRIDRERFEMLVAESRSRMQNALLQSEQVARLLAERGDVNTTSHSNPLIPSHVHNEQVARRGAVSSIGTTSHNNPLVQSHIPSGQVARLLAERDAVSSTSHSGPLIPSLVPSEQISNKEMVRPAFLDATNQTLDRNPAHLLVTASGPSTQLVRKVAQTTVRSTSSICPLMSCRANVPSLQEHVLYAHLPACFADISDKSSTTLRKRNVVLHAFAQEFTGGEGLPGLFEMVESSGLMSKASEVEADWLPALQAFSEFLGETVPACYTLHPPSSFAVLTHWRVLLQLLCAAGKDMQERYSQQSLLYKAQQASAQAVSGIHQAAGESTDVSVALTGTPFELFATSSITRATAAQPVSSMSVTDSEGYIAAGQKDLFLVGNNSTLSRARSSARPSTVDHSARQTEQGGRKRKRTPSPEDKLTIEYDHMRTGEPAEVHHGALMHDSYGSRDRYRDVSPGPEGRLTMPPSMTSPTESMYRERRMSPSLSEHGRRQLEGHERPPRLAGDQAFLDIDSERAVSSRNPYTVDARGGPGIEQSTSKCADNRSVSDVPTAIDCHFYLDIVAITLFGKDKLRKTSVGVNVLRSSCIAPETNRIKLVGGIGTFSNPEHFDLLPSVHSRVEKARWYTEDGCLGLSVGLNPKYSEDVTDRLLQRIGDLARLPCMKAFGDIGLSYSTGSQSDWAQQRVVLRKLLRLAPSSLPIKLSCRKVPSDAARKTGVSAYQDLLDIAKEELSSLQPIYLVSFSGTVNVVEDWIARFPNCFFGISPKCISSESDVREAIQFIPDDHLLLESSAPAFPIPGYKKNSPLMLGVLAMYVAKIRGVDDARHLLNVTTENARRLFKIV